MAVLPTRFPYLAPFLNHKLLSKSKLKHDSHHALPMIPKTWLRYHGLIYDSQFLQLRLLIFFFRISIIADYQLEYVRPKEKRQNQPPAISIPQWNILRVVQNNRLPITNTNLKWVELVRRWVVRVRDDGKKEDVARNDGI